MALGGIRPTLSQSSGFFGRSVGTGQRGFSTRLPENPSLAAARARGRRTARSTSLARSQPRVPRSRYLGEGPENVSDVEGLFDETGLPTRLPRNAREAMLFQLQSSRAARQQQSRQTAAALSSLRFGIGQTQNQSPYGLGALMNPLLSQMAGVQERVQFQPSDFSLFIRPDPFNEGLDNVGGGSIRNASQLAGGSRGPIFGPARRVPSPIGMGFQPEPQQSSTAQPVASFGFTGFEQPFLIDLSDEPDQPLLSDFRPSLDGGDVEPL